MKKQIAKNIVLKLGSKCNLNCKYCHCEEMNFELNKDIFKYIKSNSINRITFSGGEPLLYFNEIKEIMETLGNGYTYKFVTNATLLTESNTDFLNQFDIEVYASYDGSLNQRDKFGWPKYVLLNKFKKHGFAVTVYKENNNLQLLEKDINELRNRNRISGYKNSYFPNFVHQTSLSPNENITKEVVDKYIIQFCNRLELECFFFNKRKDGYNYSVSFLYGVLTKWFIKRDYKDGIRCCNPLVENLTISGDFLLCPYNKITVGNIYDGINWDKVNSFIPEKCKKCELFDICKNPCVMNITDNECYIFRMVYKHFQKLIKKYNLNIEEIKESIIKN